MRKREIPRQRQDNGPGFGSGFGGYPGYSYRTYICNGPCRPLYGNPYGPWVCEGPCYRSGFAPGFGGGWFGQGKKK